MLAPFTANRLNTQWLAIRKRRHQSHFVVKQDFTGSTVRNPFPLGQFWFHSMTTISPATAPAESTLPKSCTGILGLDEITEGGFPAGRPTLICGGAGCGKTLMALEFLVRGATQFDEPGVFLAFEETVAELTQNVRSLGMDLAQLSLEKKLVVDHVHVDRSEIEETGEYDLEGLFIRLGHAIDSIGAKRVVLDTLESLFSGLSNTAILRAELRRLFRWLKDRGVTSVITAERGDGTLTKHGLEEYVSDCVILLDHRVSEQLSTRRLRIVKYRGTTHGTNEFPFLIDEGGISVLPITSVKLDHAASEERVSTGITGLDAMLSDQGYFRGSSILISGTAGTGKTSIAAHFAHATCQRGERCLFFAFEESTAQLVRNMRSIGLDLQPWISGDLLQIQSARPSLFGLEMHLALLHKIVHEFKPRSVIIDPISNFLATGSDFEVRSMLTRLIDYLKNQQITALFTSLTAGGAPIEESGAEISSVIDTWLLVRDLEANGERNRGIYVLKSRGMPHSKKVREFLISSAGIELAEIYVGAEGILCGAARLEQLGKDNAALVARQQALNRRKHNLERKRKLLEMQLAALSDEATAVSNNLQQRQAGNTGDGNTDKHTHKHG
jgi:circadian clock protein KaiC